MESEGTGDRGTNEIRVATICSSRIVVRAIPKDTIGNPIESKDKRRRRLWTALAFCYIAYNHNDERTELAVNSFDRKLTSNCANH